MCLLILQLAGTIVETSALKEAFSSNSDGAGFAWADGEKCWSRKGYFNADDFVHDYEEIAAKGLPMLVHFRLATHGSEDHTNCHPFDVGGGWYMAHNGVLNIKTIGTESDTAAFARTIRPLLERDTDLIRQEAAQQVLLERIGTSNKLAFLRSDGEYVIINESAGHWHKGVWYSNHSYQTCSWRGYSYGGADSYEDYWQRYGTRHSVVTTTPHAPKDDKVTPTGPSPKSGEGSGPGYYCTVHAVDGKVTKTWVSTAKDDPDSEGNKIVRPHSWVEETYQRALAEQQALPLDEQQDNTGTATTDDDRYAEWAAEQEAAELEAEAKLKQGGTSSLLPYHFLGLTHLDQCEECQVSITDLFSEDEPVFVDLVNQVIYCSECACKVQV